MTDQPTLLFLHGVGTGDPADAWRVALSGALVRIGYPELTDDRFIAPKYAHALTGSDDPGRVPPYSSKQPGKEADRVNRRAFERRTAALEYRLGRHHDPGVKWIGPDRLVSIAFETPPFKQAHNYLHNERIRAGVLRRVLDRTPRSGKLVIVGHSLGSVIAADLLRRLPTGVEVVGMVTIGSPLGNGGVDVDDLRDAMRQAPTNLGWWVNFWNEHDPVAAHRGLSSVFPWMLDLRVSTLPSVRVHSAVEYLSDATVAETIGYGLYGSRSRAVVPVSVGLDVPLDDPERLGLLALRYAHLIGRHLDGDEGDRFAGALRHVQATAIDSMRKRRLDDVRQIPELVQLLAFDLADPEAEPPSPGPTGFLDRDDAVVPLTVLASENILRPFEIAVPRKTMRKAMEDLAAELGLGSQFGAHVFEAGQTADEVVNPGRGVNWVRLGLMGAGAAALVVATGGLALVAAPGVVGAAAVTSALAAFGPGGMIGGLVTAGSLVAAGGGGIAYGLAGASTTAEALEAVVSRQLTAVLLRDLESLDQDPSVWRNLVEIERQVRREHERLDEFSDPSAPSLKELQRKVQAVERALAHIRKMGLEPRL